MSFLRKQESRLPRAAPVSFLRKQESSKNNWIPTSAGMTYKEAPCHSRASGNPGCGGPAPVFRLGKGNSGNTFWTPALAAATRDGASSTNCRRFLRLKVPGEKISSRWFIIPADFHKIKGLLRCRRRREPLLQPIGGQKARVPFPIHRYTQKGGGIFGPNGGRVSPVDFFPGGYPAPLQARCRPAGMRRRRTGCQELLSWPEGWYGLGKHPSRMKGQVVVAEDGLLRPVCVAGGPLEGQGRGGQWT